MPTSARRDRHRLDTVVLVPACRHRSGGTDRALEVDDHVHGVGLPLRAGPCRRCPASRSARRRATPAGSPSWRSQVRPSPSRPGVQVFHRHAVSRRRSARPGDTLRRQSARATDLHVSVPFAGARPPRARVLRVEQPVGRRWRPRPGLGCPVEVALDRDHRIGGTSALVDERRACPSAGSRAAPESTAPVGRPITVAGCTASAPGLSGFGAVGSTNTAVDPAGTREAGGVVVRTRHGVSPPSSSQPGARVHHPRVLHRRDRRRCWSRAPLDVSP